MKGITLFSAPKPFRDPRIATIQANALASWSRLPNVEVILMGSAEGVADAAREYHTAYLPDVRTNTSGTPLISSMIEHARQRSQGRLLGIINADIIALPDLVDAAMNAAAQLPQFLLLGRRWDLDVDARLDLSEGWVSRLRMKVHTGGTLHKPAGSDYFIFPKQLYAEVPDFAVGRAGWDNWMIFDARRRRVPVIDCTPSAMLVHQNHDYAHLPGGVPHYALPETDENIRLAGGTAAIRYTVLDATHILREGRLAPPPVSRARISRGMELFLRRVLFFLPPKQMEAMARPRRWLRRWERLRRGSPGFVQGPEAEGKIGRSQDGR